MHNTRVVLSLFWTSESRLDRMDLLKSVVPSYRALTQIAVYQSKYCPDHHIPYRWSENLVEKTVFPIVRQE